MERKEEALDAMSHEIVDIISAEPVSEADVQDLADVEMEQAVVHAEPRKGQGIAAFFPQSNPEDSEESADAQEKPDPDVKSFDGETEVPLHKNGKLQSVIECMLFVSTEPLSARQIAENLGIEEQRVNEALEQLSNELDSRSGLQLMRVAGGYQLSTRPEYADYCAMILQPAKKKLSKAALETLAVIAYRQPCTMPEIEAVRGVSVDGVMKTLIERGLVKEAGRKQTPGRPMLYTTTQEFLEYFGLNDISELPDIDMLAVEEVKALESQKEMLISDISEFKPEADSSDNSNAE